MSVWRKYVYRLTSSTNISTVNALNGNVFFVKKKERGRGHRKRSWGIEMNNARQLYLASYGRVDTYDSLIKKVGAYTVSWKYWHSPKNHCLAMVVVTAYDMYCEVTREAYTKFGLSVEEAKKCRLEFHEFREQLSLQGLNYNPINKMYPGDKLMRVNTSKPKNTVGGIDSAKKSNNRPKKTSKAKDVTIEQLMDCKKGARTRLCGDLTKYSSHVKSEERVSNMVCVFCGEMAYTKCGICNAALHNNPSSGKCKGRMCFLDYHSDVCFGLAKNDSHMIRKRKTDWQMPNEQQRKANRDLVLTLQGVKKQRQVVTPSTRALRSTGGNR